jgi:hypothetical protein
MELLSPVKDTEPIPGYTSDLSLPPGQRYTALAEACKSKLLAPPILFDEILTWYQAALGWWFRPFIMKYLASILLRRVYDAE